MSNEEDYNELLTDLAEARNAINMSRAERLKDDSSPFNPSLTEEDASWVIKKSIEANKKEDELKKSTTKKFSIKKVKVE